MVIFSEKCRISLSYPVTIFDLSCKKHVLLDKQKSKMHSGTILNYLSLILVNDDIIFSSTTEFSNGGGIS